MDANPVYLPDPVTADPVDGDPATGMDGDTSSVFLDTDDSVTGTMGHYVVVNNPLLLNEGCDLRTAWKVHVCQTKYVTLAVGTRDGGSRVITPLALRRAEGVVQIQWGGCNGSTSANSSVFPDRGATRSLLQAAPHSGWPLYRLGGGIAGYA